MSVRPIGGTMKTMKVAMLCIGVVLLGVTTSPAGDIPGEIYVQVGSLFGGWDSSSERSGALTGVGVTIDWAVTDYSAEFTFIGNASGSAGDYTFFFMSWADTGDRLPLSAQITSATPWPYDVYITMDENDSLTESDRTGDWYFGHYLPYLSNFRFGVGLSSGYSGGDVNLSVIMEWGPGVPASPSTWGGIKSLYR